MNGADSKKQYNQHLSSTVSYKDLMAEQGVLKNCELMFNLFTQTITITFKTYIMPF